MMFFLLLAAYGLTFAIQHKIPWIHGKSKFIDEMLACTFCTGFHAGWFIWAWWNLTVLDAFGWGGILPFALASSGTSYLLDSLGQHLEASGD